jgi:hypothetical protein
MIAPPRSPNVVAIAIAPAVTGRTLSGSHAPICRLNGQFSGRGTPLERKRHSGYTLALWLDR